MSEIVLKNDALILTFDTKSLNFAVAKGSKSFFCDNARNAYLQAYIGKTLQKIPLDAARCKQARPFKDGLGEGIEIKLSDFEQGDLRLNAKYVCHIRLDGARVLCSLTAEKESEEELAEVVWPAHFDFRYRGGAYSVLPIMQGNLLYNDTDAHVCGFEPSVFFERMGYMPFFGQLTDGIGYLCIADTPYDAGYCIEHPCAGETKLNIVWLSSMGKVKYTRKLIYEFVQGGDYNSLCKSFRRYAKERGYYRSLAEKIAAKPILKKMIGSPVIHTGALYSVKPGTEYYSEQDPAQNYRLQTFAKIARKLGRLKEKGLKKAYLHLDGWGRAGYDNQHPDVFPPNEAAGGTEGLSELLRVCRKNRILFALHDQYRDYYTDAETFDEKNALMDRTGKRPGECRWFGGEQRYLCTSLAQGYLRRNLGLLREAGILPDGIYLDVFSVMQPEECYDPMHKMTREENIGYRKDCFAYLNAQGLISSSEEPVAWAVPYMDLVHHAPYCFPIEEFPYELVPVPLFNLVFHDCMIVPWDIGEDPWGLPKGKDGFLYALLNGGTAYLPLDADEEQMRRAAEVCEFYEKVCKEEMIRHERCGENVERAWFESYMVEVDFRKKSYRIERSKL